eukprot:4476820-Prorocentrum_lima.AAC.1
MLAGRSISDIRHKTLLPELKYDEPQSLITAMRSLDVPHECGADHMVVMRYRHMGLVGMEVSREIYWV